MRNKKETKEVNAIIKLCTTKDMTIREGVRAIDDIIGGIASVKYNSDLLFKITSTTGENYKINMIGYRQKEAKILPEIALIAYTQAQMNGHTKPGEVHISRQVSTKHHKENLEKIIEYIV